MHINHPPPGQATKTKWKATQEEVSPQGGRTLYCLGSTHLPMAWIRTPAITHGMTHGMTHGITHGMIHDMNHHLCYAAVARPLLLIYWGSKKAAAARSKTTDFTSAQL